MQCQHVHENLSDYVAGQLDRALAITLENHVLHCASCREEVAGFRRMWSLLEELPAVDTPLYFHENLMHRVNADIDRIAAANANRRALWNWRSLFQPRALAAATAILIVVLGGIGYVKTQPAALGPIGLWPGAAPQAPATTIAFQPPTLAWVNGAHDEQALKVQFHLDNIDTSALSGLEYTVAVGDSVQTAKDLLTQPVPAGGKVNVLVPLAQTSASTPNTIVITLHSTQDSRRKLPDWVGSLPPQP